MQQQPNTLQTLIKAGRTSWYGVKLYWACCELGAENGVELHRSARAVLLALMSRTFRCTKGKGKTEPESQGIRPDDLYNLMHWCGMSRRSTYNGLNELRRLEIVTTRREVDLPGHVDDDEFRSDASAEVVDEHRFIGVMKTTAGQVKRTMRNPDHAFLALLTSTNWDPREEIRGVELDIIRFIAYATRHDGVLDVTNARIAGAVGCGDWAAKKAMKGLVDAGALVRTRRGSHDRASGQGVSSTYEVRFLDLARHLYGDEAVDGIVARSVSVPESRHPLRVVS